MINISIYKYPQFTYYSKKKYDLFLSLFFIHQLRLIFPESNNSIKISFTKRD